MSLGQSYISFKHTFNFQARVFVIHWQFSYKCVIKREGDKWRHDILHNDIHLNDIEHYWVICICDT